MREFRGVNHSVFRLTVLLSGSNQVRYKCSCSTRLLELRVRHCYQPGDLLGLQVRKLEYEAPSLLPTFHLSYCVGLDCISFREGSPCQSFERSSCVLRFGLGYF